MELNVGRTDRVMRLILGLALVFSPLLNIPAIWSSAILAYAAMIIGLVFLLTGVVGFCPAYRLLGVRTRKMP